METVDDEYCYSDDESITIAASSPPIDINHMKYTIQISDAYGDDMFPDVPCVIDSYLTEYATGIIKITCEDIDFTFNITSLAPLKIKSLSITNESMIKSVNYIARKNLLQIFVQLLCFPTIEDMTTFLMESFTLVDVKEIPILKLKKISVSESASQVAELMATPLSTIYKKKNPFSRLMNITKYCMKYYTHHCSICGRVLEYPSDINNVPICNNDLCKYILIESPKYFDVLTYLKTGKLPILKIFTNIVIEALKSSKPDILLSPLQQTYLYYTDDIQHIDVAKLAFNIKTIQELIPTFESVETITNEIIDKIIYNHIQTAKYVGVFGEKSDIDVKIKIDANEIYSTLWWLLCTVKCNYISTEHIPYSDIKIDDAILKLANLKGIIALQHSQAEFKTIREKHHKIPIKTVYHGSATGNWLSIMRHGLKNLSNTTHMANGAAYGTGIYTASEFATASGYSARTTTTYFVAKCSAIPVSITDGGTELAVRCEPTPTFFIFVDDRYLMIDYILIFG